VLCDSWGFVCLAFCVTAGVFCDSWGIVCHLGVFLSGLLCDSWGFVCLVCCVTAGGLCVFVVLFLACFKSVFLLNRILLLFIYMSFYLECRVTYYSFVVLLKQITLQSKNMSIVVVVVVKGNKCRVFWQL